MVDIKDELRRYAKTFPATELKPYAEPVSPDGLKRGRVYFSLQYLDSDLLVPVLQPLIFLGYDLDGDDPRLRFFQDFDSFRAGIRYSKRTEEESTYFEVCGPEDGKHIFEYEQALEQLMSCALRRREQADLDEHVLRLTLEAAPGE